MDVRTEMLVFFSGISAWTSAGYPAPKLTLWAASSFLISNSKRIQKCKCNLWVTDPFLFTLELLCLQLYLGASCLQLERFYLQMELFYLRMKHVCLHWQSEEVEAGSKTSFPLSCSQKCSNFLITFSQSLQQSSQNCLWSPRNSNNLYAKAPLL